MPKPAKNENTKDTNAVVIYHANCLDGMASAWVVSKVIGTHGVYYHPGTYGDPPPDVKGKLVFIVDFSYDRETLIKMSMQAKHITLIDHHEKAANALKDVSQELHCQNHIVFDMDQCGCVLTWYHLMPESYPVQEIPKLLLHIQDRDLWKFELPDTREILAGATASGLDLLRFSLLLDTPLLDLKKIGTPIVLREKYIIKTIVNTTAAIRKIGKDNVPVVNCPPMFINETCEVMCTRFTQYPFVASYYDSAQYRVFSVRSNQTTDVNVNKIASQFGGGGHPHASGFRLPIADIDQCPLIGPLPDGLLPVTDI